MRYSRCSKWKTCSDFAGCLTSTAHYCPYAKKSNKMERGLKLHKRFIETGAKERKALKKDWIWFQQELGKTEDEKTIWTNILTKNQQIIFRKNVLERDSYICQYCDSREKPHAHHLLVGSNNPDDGITLCQICHSHVHTNARDL